ncbi:ROK family protein [Facilibium subflavum]|uniref:ROK family protein n=1 Tax=Facilibium subflavum TaxID=2219058 RepID=UPI000E650330|nr:ROK family protein [Facilibium subflavum]
MYLCFDLGGTFIKYGVVDNKGQLIFNAQMHTGELTQAQELVARLVTIFKHLSLQHQFDGVGLCTHGVVDTQEGRITLGSSYVKALVNYPLKQLLQQQTKLPVCMDNDVNAALLGELWQGAAIGLKQGVMVTLGTSIGGAIIIDGKLYRGRNNTAGELGYIITNEKAAKDAGMVRGAWAQFASASSLLQQYRIATSKAQVTVEFLLDAINKNEQEAMNVLDDYAYHVSSGLVSIAHILAPETIIIGGAISKQEIIIKRIKAAFQARAMPLYQDTPIIPAKCQNNAGLVGMAFLLSCEDQHG